MADKSNPPQEPTKTTEPSNPDELRKCPNCGRTLQPSQVHTQEEDEKYNAEQAKKAGNQGSPQTAGR